MTFLVPKLSLVPKLQLGNLAKISAPLLRRARAAASENPGPLAGPFRCRRQV